MFTLQSFLIVCLFNCVFDKNRSVASDKTEGDSGFHPRQETLSRAEWWAACLQKPGREASGWPLPHDWLLLDPRLLPQAGRVASPQKGRAEIFPPPPHHGPMASALWFVWVPGKLFLILRPAWF